MKRDILIIVGIALIIALGWIGYQYLGQPGRLHTATPDEVGLNWQECVLSSYPTDFDWKEVEDCLDHPMSFERSEEESENFATKIDNYGLQLTVGQDVYRAEVSEGDFPTQTHTLYKNGTPLVSLRGTSGSHLPNISLQSIGDHVAWEYMAWESLPGDTIATIIYDGRDMREVYGLDEAYRPYGIADALIFVGKKGDEYFIVYDGMRVGPAFDEIIIAHCCEPAFYSVHFGQGKYLFLGTRDGEPRVVEITTQKK